LLLSLGFSLNEEQYMPFVKRNNSQPQNDAHKIFVGREGELLFFIQNILKPEDPTHNIISISGQGGVGKSTLLTRLIDEAHTTDFKDYCLTAIVDERQITPTDIMGKFANQLHITGDFEKAFRQYKEALRKLQTEQETMQDIVLRKTPDFTGAAAEGIPIVGPILREGVKTTTGHLLEKYHTNQLYRDKERLENPIDDLTHAFVQDLNRLTDAQVTLSSLQAKRHRRAILFFDTFEQLASVAVPWLLDHFLQANISNNVVLIIAGRDPIEHSTSDGPKQWLPYLDNHVIYSISLDSFTEDETRTYLTKRGITDSNRAATFWQLSGGLPLYLGLLTSNPFGRVDPTKDVVVNFLRWIPEQEALKRQLALDAALLSRPFNKDDLEAFSYIPEKEQSNLYQWLIGLPFVRTSPLDGRHSYHDLVQALFSRHLYQRSRNEYYSTRRALAEHYQKQLEKIQAEGYKPITPSSGQGRPIYRSDEWLELAMAIAYQLFLQPDASSHQEAMKQVLHAYEYTDQTGEMVRVLRKLIQEQPNNFLSSNAQQSIKLLLRYIEADPPMYWQELLIAADDLLRTVAHEPLFSAELLAHIYRKRGFAYKRLGEYQRAIVDYDRAIELDPNYARAYASRGSAFRNLREYKRAIEDYNRALENRPSYLWAYAGRGQAYSLLKEYTHAIKDLNHAIELEPNYGWAYFLRGYTHLWLKDSVQARADFIRSGELSPKDVSARWMVEWSRMGQERPDAGMIERLEGIATLDPKHFWAPVCRGAALWLSNRFEDALAILEQAISLKPEASDNYFWQGMTYASLVEYTTAMVAIEKALELELPPILLSPLHWFEQERPDFYQKSAVPLLRHYSLL
jgi:tetratricopeptide (TPR) repeat protein